MINIEKAKEELIMYINKESTKNERTELKKEHILRVSENCGKIAENLNLTKEYIEIAKLIGLLHDIGRFEQYQLFGYNTKNSGKKFDHGEAGVEILRKDNYIRKFIEDTKYDNIIYNAIYEHNKYTLNESLSDEEKLFCKIVKDADKLDLLYEGVYKYWQDEERIKQVEEGELSKKMLQDFYNKKLANNVNSISETDQILRFVSFIYDLNFEYSFYVLEQNDYISKLVNRFNYKIKETKESMENVNDIANRYIKSKTN